MCCDHSLLHFHTVTDTAVPLYGSSTAPLLLNIRKGISHKTVYRGFGSHLPVQRESDTNSALLRPRWSAKPHVQRNMTPNATVHRLGKSRVGTYRHMARSSLFYGLQHIDRCAKQPQPRQLWT
ncbi:unnamed protein product [Laminaria digitata]